MTDKQYFDESYSKNAPENYERYFVPVIGDPLARDLVPVADLRPGERVLDVACGTGVVARLASERVGETGAVAGVDLHPGMLAVAREAAPGDASIEWHEGNAEALPLPDEAFDAVLCQMSLQFVPGKLDALREMRRVLVEGGRTVLNVPGPAGPMFTLLAEAMGRHIGPAAAGFVAHVFSLNDAAELERLMETAGFRDVAVQVGRKTFSLPAPDEFLWQYVHSTPLGGEVAKADEAARTALEQEVVAGWKEFIEDGRVNYEQEFLTATGRK